LEALGTLAPQMVKECMIPRFLDCFYECCKDEEIRAFVDHMVCDLDIELGENGNVRKLPLRAMRYKGV